jgi:hypothetical protein
MTSIYDKLDVPAGSRPTTGNDRDPVPEEGFYPRCVIHEVSEFTKDHKQFFKIRYEILEGKNQGTFFTQFKTLKGCPDEKVTALEADPIYKYPNYPAAGQLTMGQKAMAEIKQAIGAAFGMTVEQANAPGTGVSGARVRDAATEAQPCRGLVVAMQVSYERYVKKDDPRKGQVKGEPGNPYIVFSAFPVSKDGSLTEHALGPVAPKSYGKKAESVAPVAPPPPPSSGVTLPWKVNPNAPDWAYNTQDASAPQRKVSSF